MAQVICQICGKEFTAKRSDAKYCDDDCKKAAKCATTAAWAAKPEIAAKRRDQNAKRMRKLREENPEKYREEYKQWYEEKGIEYHKQWRDEHPEYRKSVAERQRQREKDNPGLKKRKDALYYQRHKEQVKANVQAWQEANPEILRQSRQVRNIRRRARLALATGDWTYQEFQELCEASTNHCWYCHKKFDKLTADHMTPIARGGSNDISNIVPACLSCNASKGAKTPLEFISYIKIF
jgi:hypothetical protein